jgi:hypothetical protein
MIPEKNLKDRVSKRGYFLAKNEKSSQCQGDEGGQNDTKD